MVSDRTIQRLSLYRRTLQKLSAEGRISVFSHQIAAETGVSAAQVRRDLMSIGYSGSPNRGYETIELLRSIGERLDDPQGQSVALVGVGNLGRAIIAYVSRQRRALTVGAAFDKDPTKVGRVILGCRVHALAELDALLRASGIRVAILTVPAAEAQEVADRLVAAGVTGILNFAPATLRVPADVFVEGLDFTTALEKVAFFARREPQRPKA